MKHNKGTVSPFAGDKALLAMVCILGPALVSLIPMAAVPALPAMASHFSNSGNGQLFSQMVMTVPAISLVLFSPVAGLIVEKYGVYRCLLISLLIYTLAGFSVLFIDDATLIIGCRLLLGVAGGGILTTCLTMIGDKFSGEAREQLLGYATALASLFAATAMVFGGELVDRWGWRASFALYLLGFPVLLAAWQSMTNSLVPAQRVSAQRGQAERGHHILIPLWPYYLLLVLLTIGMFSPSIQGPFALESKGITSATERGMIVGATSIMAFFSASAYGKLRRYLAAHTVLAIDALCMGLGLMMFALAPNSAVMVLGCAFVGIGAGMSEPAIASIIVQKTPVQVHGLAMGLIVSSLNAGQFTNPLAMNPLSQTFSIGTSLLVLGALLFAVGILLTVQAKQATTHPLHPIG